MTSWVERVHTCVLIFGVAGGTQAMEAGGLAPWEELKDDSSVDNLGVGWALAVLAFLQDACVRDQQSKAYVSGRAPSGHVA